MPVLHRTPTELTMAPICSRPYMSNIILGSVPTVLIFPRRTPPIQQFKLCPPLSRSSLCDSFASLLLAVSSLPSLLNLPPKSASLPSSRLLAGSRAFHHLASSIMPPSLSPHLPIFGIFFTSSHDIHVLIHFVTHGRYHLETGELIE